jgi:hypothetical protein
MAVLSLSMALFDMDWHAFIVASLLLGIIHMFAASAALEKTT